MPEAMADESAGTALAAVLKEAEESLAAAGVADARRDARILLAAAWDRPVRSLLPHGRDKVPAAVRGRFSEMLDRRRRRIPVGRILGEVEFWSLPFRVTTETLEPRPDSETLIEATLASAGSGEALSPDGARTVLDLGTGSGCLLLSLLHEWPRASGLGIDIAPGAVTAAADNAARLDIGARARFMVADWNAPDFCDLLGGRRFDIVIGNPPYIAKGDIGDLMPEVRDCDPHIALNGGPDGLFAYRRLLALLPDLLLPAGLAVFELGAGQANSVVDLAGRHGYRPVAIKDDLTGTPRALVLAQG